MKTENKRNALSTILYIGGAIVAITGIAQLVTAITYYSDTFNQAVAAGYDAAQVSAQLLPSQLLPGVFQAIGVYGGIALMLICMGMIYQKVSNYMNQSNSDKINVGAPEINAAELTEIEKNDASANVELAAMDNENNEIAGTNEQPTEEKL